MWVGIFTLHDSAHTTYFPIPDSLIKTTTTESFPVCLHIPPPHILIDEKSVFPWLFESPKRPIYGHSKTSIFSNMKILFIVSMNTALAVLIIDTTLLVRKHILL
jgi:hypothetical protein